MRYAIDRFEEQTAILQDDSGKTVKADRSFLPPDAAQGDVLQYVNGRYEHDREETCTRRERIYRLEQLLRGKGKDV